MKVYELITELSKCPAGAKVKLSHEWINHIEEGETIFTGGTVNAVLIPRNGLFIYLDGD